MNALVPVALFGWPLVTLALYAVLSPRKAFVSAAVAGWLLLPVQTFSMRGFIDIDKYSVIALSSFLALVLFDFRRLAAFKPALIDIPTVLYCMSGIPASVTNDLGLYDGVSISLRTFLHWGAFWFLGRIYLNDLKGLLLLCRALFVGGLLYAPLCLWEVRMSPSLHGNLYGSVVYQGITYAQDLGKWGSRPSVFLKNPLELGMFLCMACLSGYALALTRAQRMTWGMPTPLLVAGLIGVSLLCKNLGATVLLATGVIVLTLVRRRRSMLPLLALLLIPPTYISLRATSLWDGQEIAQVASVVHPEKGSSFGFRLQNEDVLVEKALQKPLFGWGAWSRWKVFDEYGRDMSIADGLWVISLGQWGLLGLSMMLISMCVPVVTVSKRLGREVLRSDLVLPALVHAALTALLLVDFIPNDFPNPLILIGAGGIASLPAIRGGRSKRTGQPPPGDGALTTDR